MKDLRAVVVALFPGESIVRETRAWYRFEGTSRLGPVPVGWARGRSLHAVPLLETDRCLYLDRRPSAVTLARRVVRTGTPIALLFAATLALPISSTAHAALLVPAAIAAMYVAVALADWQLN